MQNGNMFLIYGEMLFICAFPIFFCLFFFFNSHFDICMSGFHNFVRCFSNKTLFIFPLLLSFFHIYITFFHILFFSFVFKLYLYSKYPISGIFLFYFLHFDIFNVKIRYRAILHHLIFWRKDMILWILWTRTTLS